MQLEQAGHRTQLDKHILRRTPKDEATKDAASVLHSALLAMTIIRRLVRL